ncbi:hypothetical protein FGF1_13080 [Flavobacteriaceae bacterium GF1]
MRKALGYSQIELAEFIGIKQGSLSDIERGKTKDLSSPIKRILKENHHINIDFLYNLSEDIFIDISVPPTSPKPENPNGMWVTYDRFKLVPLVSHRAQAGFMAGWGDDEYLDDLPKVPWEVDKEYKGNYLTFEVSGDSMESDEYPRESLFEGDLLLCREVQIHHWENKLHINKWDFVVAHREHGILVKRVVKHNTATGQLTLHSLNSYYEDFVVNLNDVLAIFNIVDIKRSRRR